MVIYPSAEAAGKFTVINSDFPAVFGGKNVIPPVSFHLRYIRRNRNLRNEYALPGLRR